MKLKKQIGFIFSGLLFFIYACSNKPEVIVQQKIPNADSLVVVKKDSSTETLESKIMDAVMRLPEVEKINLYIDSFSNHKKGVAAIMDVPEKGETDYGVRVGYNGDERFEVYNFFYVNPNSFDVKILDIVTDSIVPIEEWRKRSVK